MKRFRSLFLALLVLGQALIAVHSHAAAPDLAPTSGHLSLPSDVAAWLGDPFVARTLQSSDLQDVTEALRYRGGFLAAYPVPDAGGSYVAYWEGTVPLDAPSTSPAGLTIRHESNVRVDPLIARASSDADASSLEDLEGDEETAAGVPTPGVVQGIGPGGPIQMVKANAAGQLGTYICSASYLFRNPATGIYYLATAGHCLLDEGVLSSKENPLARARSISLCFADCVNNWLGVGEYVELRPDDAYPGYHPVAWAEQRGVGRDFGFIEIPSSLNGLLRSRLWFWGGPTRFEVPSTGDPLVHYGFGIGLGQAVPTQGRAAVHLAPSGEGGHGAVGWVNGGDSGSAFGTASLRPDGSISGDGAAGTITHAITGVGLPLMFGTDMGHALGIAQGELGFAPSLVTESEPIGAPAPAPTTEPSPTNQPSPSPSSEPSPEPSPTQPTPSPSGSPDDVPQVRTERSVSLTADRIVGGRRVRLFGDIEASEGCRAEQVVRLIARPRGDERFRAIGVTWSDASGHFLTRHRPSGTTSYRAIALATQDCPRARSPIVTVRVRS